MKKIMMAAAIVCAAAFAQAAQFDWKTAKSQNVQAPSGLTMVGGTAYIFTSDMASTIVSAFAAGNDWTTGALDSSSITSAGKISIKDTKFEYGGAGKAANISAIFAVVETIGGADYLYISTVANASGPATGSENISFSEGSVSTTVMDAGKGYSTAGWYAAAPEPTSGLLLLIGMAGLALRRRRA